MQELALGFWGKEDAQPQSHLPGLIRVAREAPSSQTPGIPPALVPVAPVRNQESTRRRHGCRVLQPGLPPLLRGPQEQNYGCLICLFPVEWS